MITQNPRSSGRILPEIGQDTCSNWRPASKKLIVPDPVASADPFPQDLARYLAASTGLPQATALRVVADVATYFNETIDEFVRRRHAELQRRQRTNDEIWPLIATELGQRRFAAPGLSQRQLRRIVYDKKRQLDRRQPDRRS